jgi:hypothetical protein
VEGLISQCWSSRAPFVHFEYWQTVVEITSFISPITISQYFCCNRNCCSKRTNSRPAYTRPKRSRSKV